MFWRKAIPLLLVMSNAAALEGFILGGGVEADSTDGVSVSALGDFGLAENTWLSVAAAHSSVEIVRGASLDTWYGDLSLDHWFEPVGVRVGVAYWGDSDLLDSIDWQGSLYWRNERFSIGADYEHRDFNFELPAFDVFPGREAEFDAQGIGLSTRFELTDDVSLGFNGMDYDYSVNLRVGDNQSVLQFLSFSRLSLINSLVDYRAYATLGVDVDKQRWQFDLGTWKGEADGGVTTSATLRFLTPLSDNTDIEFSLGVDDSDLYGDVTFFSVFIFFYGD